MNQPIHFDPEHYETKIHQYTTHIEELTNQHPKNQWEQELTQLENGLVSSELAQKIREKIETHYHPYIDHTINEHTQTRNLYTKQYNQYITQDQTHADTLKQSYPQE